MSLKPTLNRLERLMVATGGHEGDPDMKRSTVMNNPNANVLDSLSPEEVEKYEKMSKYGQDQFKMALELQFMRKQLAQLEEMEEKNFEHQKKILKGDPPYSRTEQSKLTSEIRKRLQKIAVAQKELQKSAHQEGRIEDAKEVIRHIETTRQLYKKRFAIPTNDRASAYPDQELGSLGSDAAERTSLLKNIDTLPEPSSECRESLRDDQEFVQFFEAVAQRDHQIDEAVDRIYQGTLRLKENALGIKDELQSQNRLLKETETKVDNINVQMKGLNKKLKKTIKDVDSDRLCIYICCCVVLLGILGYILYATGVLGK